MKSLIGYLSNPKIIHKSEGDWNSIGTEGTYILSNSIFIHCTCTVYFNCVHNSVRLKGVLNIFEGLLQEISKFRLVLMIIYEASTKIDHDNKDYVYSIVILHNLHTT